MTVTPNFCKNGHDKNVVGVLKSGYCRECGRQSRRDQWANATPEQRKANSEYQRRRYQAGLTQTNITTETCPRGHLKSAGGVLRNGACKVCTRESERLRRANMTPEQREKIRTQQRDRYARMDDDAQRLAHILQGYGLDDDTYNAMRKAQNDLCAICQHPETRTRDGKVQNLHVDHDHKTDKVRALLCSRCNVAIGYLRDSPELCEAAAAYLRSWIQT